MTHLAQSQDPALAMLADPATHGGAPVRRIDTHAGIVFLAGDRALKIKRAVRFPFLDYSTLDKRKAACEAEIAVNRPFAPALYRRVVAITRENDGRLALDGAGEPVEWAVEMDRFDETRTLDLLAERGGIGLDLADQLACAVAAAHARAPCVEAAPWIAALATYIDQNEAEFSEAPDLFPVDEAAHLTRASRAMLAARRPLLELRGKEGLVRRVHGDLHLGNIAMIAGRPVPFDAVEFDPLIATGDVLYDLAFLVMDLIERGLGAAANVILNRYLIESRRYQNRHREERSDEAIQGHGGGSGLLRFARNDDDNLDGLAAMPLFLSLRAAIRAKVTAARREFAPGNDRARIAAAVTAYFRLALALIRPPPAMLVAIGGLSGTGKSALARRLAPHLWPAPGALVVRSDVERKAVFRAAETDRLPPQAYRAQVTAQVYGALADKTRRALAAGHSVVVDAVFARREERAQIEAVARAAGADFHGVFLAADLPVRLARIGARTRDASDADAAVARRQEKFDLGAMDWTRIDATGSLDDTLAAALPLLPGAEASHARRSAAHGETTGCTSPPPRA